MRPIVNCVRLSRPSESFEMAFDYREGPVIKIVLKF